MRNDLSGTEWLGSPLLGMALIAMVMTAYYFGMRNKQTRPTVHGVNWLFFLFLATTVNMLTLAHFIYGSWRDFQWMPLMGTFQLIMIAAGIHFSWKERSRGAFFILLLWTAVLFLLVTCTMASLAYAFFDGWDAWQTYTMLGIGLWTGLMMVVYLRFNSRLVSWLDALTGWGWCMCIGVSVGMSGVYFVLLGQKHLWPFYFIVGTLGLALFCTALRISLQHRREEELQ